MTDHLGDGEAAGSMTADAHGQTYQIVLRGEIGERFSVLFAGMRLEHVFAHGPHSLGLAQGALDAAAWTTLAAFWISEQSDTPPIGTQTAWN